MSDDPKSVMLPTALDVEHVLENGNTCRTVSSSDGWLLCHRDHYHDMQCRLEEAELALRAVIEAADDTSPSGGWNRLNPALTEQRTVARQIGVLLRGPSDATG